MKRAMIIGGGAVALALLVAGVALWPRAQRELDWRSAAAADSEAAYTAFLTEWPAGRHSAAARGRADARAWQAAESDGALAGYERYARDYATGAYAAEAAAAIDRLHWEPVKGAATPAGVEQFLKSYPASAYSGEAKLLQEDLAWKEAAAAGTISALDRYLRDYGTGRYAAEARAKRDARRWQEAESKNTVAAYEAYLTAEPAGASAATARARIEDIHWALALVAPTIRTLNAFAQRFPNGAHTAEARQRAAALAADDSLFRAAEGQGSQQAYRTFLADYPGHRQEETARARLTALDADLAGRHLLDLVAEGKVTVRASGGGLNMVSLSVTNTAKHDIKIVVPAGTYFLSGRASVQNMVATSQDSVVVQAGGSQVFSVSAACASINRDVPAFADGFTVQRSAPGDISRYAAAIGTDAGFNFAVRQAAVWILTDNANYSALGRLVGAGGFQRQIEEEQAVRAMQILDAAGVDLRSRAIWADRTTILGGLKDLALRRWWREKTGLPVVIPAAGATFRATFYQGGTLTFTVAADGRAVTSVRLQGYRCGENTAAGEGDVQAVITDSVFTIRGSNGLKVDGVFSSARQAQGNIEVKAGTTTCWAPFTASG